MSRKLISQELVNYLQLLVAKQKSSKLDVDSKKSLEVFKASLNTIPKAKDVFTLNDVQLGMTIGSGKFTRVYEAQTNGFPVAVAQYNPCKSAWALNEKRCLMILDHPLFLKLLHSFVEKDAFIVTELCVGDLWFNSFEISVKNQERFIIQLLQGVNYMHNKAIVHRDIRPENILLTSSNNIKLSDFKYAIVLSEGVENKKCEVPKRNPYYLPLESLQDGTFSRKSDIFMVGCIFFELNTKSLLLASRIPEKMDFQSAIKVHQFGRPKETKFNGKYSYVWGSGEDNLLRQPIAERLLKSKHHQLLERLCNVDPGIRPLASEVLEHESIKQMFFSEDFEIFDDCTEMVVPDNGKKQRESVKQQPFKFFNKNDSWSSPIALSLVNFRYQQQPDMKNVSLNAPSVAEKSTSPIFRHSQAKKMHDDKEHPANTSDVKQVLPSSLNKTVSSNEMEQMDIGNENESLQTTREVLLPKTKIRRKPRKCSVDDLNSALLTKQKPLTQNTKKRGRQRNRPVDKANSSKRNMCPATSQKRQRHKNFTELENTESPRKRLRHQSDSRSGSASRQSRSSSSSSNSSISSKSSVLSFSSSDTSSTSSSTKSYSPPKKKINERKVKKSRQNTDYPKFEMRRARSGNDKKKPLELYCKYCGEGFQSVKKLDKHKKKRHAKPKN